MPKGCSQPFGGAEAGKEVDVKDSFGHWYTCEVLEVDDADHPSAIYVPWLGWAQKYDEWVHAAACVQASRGIGQYALDRAR